MIWMARVDDDAGLRVNAAPEADGRPQTQQRAARGPWNEDSAFHRHTAVSRLSRPVTALSTQSASEPYCTA